MSKVRVLHIISRLGYGNGIINVVMNYYRNIDRKLINFDFIYLFEDSKSFKTEIIEMGGRVFKLDPPSLRNMLNYQSQISKKITENQFNYSIIHVHEPALLSLLIPAFKRDNNKVKIIAHSHSITYSSHPVKTLRNRLFSIPLQKWTDYFASCSVESAEFWFKDKAKQAKIIKNAIDCNRFVYNENLRLQARETLNISDKFVIGHVGRFSKEKNHEFLIDVFYEVSKTITNSVLLLVGSGKEENNIRIKVEKLNLGDKVIFLGNSEQVENYYNAMDTFVFPSLSEGFGTVVLEAQISGLECIVSKNVNSEVNLRDVKFLDLEEGIQRWASEIKNISRIRSDMKEYAILRGYCIKSEAKNLEEYYGRLLTE